MPAKLTLYMVMDRIGACLRRQGKATTLSYANRHFSKMVKKS